MGGNILFLGVDTFLYLIIIVICEYFENNRWENKIDEKLVTNLDELSISERAHENTQISVKNISKVFKTKRKKVLAVENYSFAVEPYECFGMLGTNGAGKAPFLKF